VEAVTSYRWHELSLVVRVDEPVGAGELSQTLSELSWVRDDTHALPPTLSLAVHRDVSRRHIPATACSLFQVEGFSGFEHGDDCYLTDGISQWYLQPRLGQGEA
jgi:hypothetical protein